MPTNGNTTAVERVKEGVRKKPLPVGALIACDAEGLDVYRVHRHEDGKMKLRHNPNEGVLEAARCNWRDVVHLGAEIDAHPRTSEPGSAYTEPYDSSEFSF